jgi:hypothetical protein
LAVPPVLYETIVERLGSAGLSLKEQPQCQLQARLVVEKPFGRYLQTATDLNRTISKWFTEPQIYRIDHYLGKETVQNIMIFRFANAIFEPVWNRNISTTADTIARRRRGTPPATTTNPAYGTSSRIPCPDAADRDRAAFVRRRHPIRRWLLRPSTIDASHRTRSDGPGQID